MSLGRSVIRVDGEGKVKCRGGFRSQQRRRASVIGPVKWSGTREQAALLVKSPRFGAVFITEGRRDSSGAIRSFTGTTTVEEEEKKPSETRIAPRTQIYMFLGRPPSMTSVTSKHQSCHYSFVTSTTTLSLGHRNDLATVSHLSSGSEKRELTGVSH